eukprot:TRINITY_DN15532_c0_g2_i1.p1 TRINITY_DN15532_c0_g2~~TRINITY_DN15532_c0_g2_i1.p1  ORF type:complete len:688 (+),score=80.62 TRINITY_DN15532_c0_g2_i1:275-2065(+)
MMLVNFIPSWKAKEIYVLIALLSLFTFASLETASTSNFASPTRGAKAATLRVIFYFSPFLLQWRLGPYLVYAGIMIVREVGLNFLIRRLHDDYRDTNFWSQAISIGFIVGCYVPFSSIARNRYFSEKQLADERRALRSLLNVQCEAVVTVDTEHKVRSDGLDSLMEASVMGQPVIHFLPNEEEQARVSNAFEKGRSSNQVVLLPTTFVINGEAVSVDLFIVYRSSVGEAFLVGVRCLQEKVPVPSSSIAQIDVHPIDLDEGSVASDLGDLGSERGTERVFEVSALRSTSELVKLGRKEHWIIEEDVLSFQKSIEIGRGGFGKVRTASFYGAKVAVKQARCPLTLESAKKRALLELRVLRHLHHPNVIEFLGACIHSKAEGLELSLVFQYVDQGITANTLASHINYEDGLSKSIRSGLLGILYDVSNALLYMHSLKPPVVHRDIKGSNVLIELLAECEMRAKICDFGLSHHIGKPLHGGTVHMMAPEALLKVPVSTAVDVFSFGRLTFLLATGRRPLMDMDRESIVKSATIGEIPQLDWPEEEQLPGCMQLANACMQFEPEKRISIGIVNNSLTQLLLRETVEVPRHDGSSCSSIQL